MFKVRDRVWFNHNKEFLKVVAISPIKGIVICQFDNGQHHKISIDDLHQTADDMFKELGFALMNQSIKGANYLQTNDCEIYPYNKDDKIQIVFYKEVEGYVVTSPLSDINVDIVIKLELHQAIHQKLIELGWVE